MKKREKKKMLLGSVAAVLSTALVFGGVSQAVKALEIGKTELVETSYDTLDLGSTNAKIPTDYEKPDYKIKFVGKNQPSVNDMKMEEAAEIASQQLWKIFRVDLNDRTLEMTYEPSSKVQQRATWEANVKINDHLSYYFVLDAITGESNWIDKTVYHDATIREGLNKDLLNNHQEYQEIAKEIVETYQLLPNVTSINYVSQGYDKNEFGNKNSNITFMAISEDDKKAQLTISTYNKELLSIGYNDWIKEGEQYEQQLLENPDDSISIMITDELIKEVERTNKPLIIKK